MGGGRRKEKSGWEREYGGEEGEEENGEGGEVSLPRQFSFKSVPVRAADRQVSVRGPTVAKDGPQQS